MPRHHSVGERPKRLVLEQLHGARDDARVGGAAEDDGAGVEGQVEDEGAVLTMEASWAEALKVSLSLGRTLLVLRECFGTGTSGMRMGLIVRVWRGGGGFDGFESKLEEQLCVPFVEPPERPRIFIFLK